MSKQTDCLDMQQQFFYAVKLNRDTFYQTLTRLTANSIKDGDYAPFIVYVYVSIAGGKMKVPVIILRDTGTSEAYILQNVLPFSSLTDTGTSILIRGFGFNVLNVPLHKIMLSS